MEEENYYKTKNNSETKYTLESGQKYMVDYW